MQNAIFHEVWGKPQLLNNGGEITHYACVYITLSLTLVQKTAQLEEVIEQQKQELDFLRSQVNMLTTTPLPPPTVEHSQRSCMVRTQVAVGEMPGHLEHSGGRSSRCSTLSRFYTCVYRCTCTCVYTCTCTCMCTCMCIACIFYKVFLLAHYVHVCIGKKTSTINFVCVCVCVCV